MIAHPPEDPGDVVVAQASTGGAVRRARCMVPDTTGGGDGVTLGQERHRMSRRVDTDD